MRPPGSSKNARAPQNAGFSLLEILLALAILGGAMAVLSQIAGTGTDAAREARDLAVARMLCQSKLSEILLDTTVTPTSVPAAPIASFAPQSLSQFQYSVEVQPAPIDGILVVRVSVQSLSTSGGPPISSYSLDRWMIDPALGLAELEAEENAAKQAADAAAAEESI